MNTIKVLGLDLGTNSIGWGIVDFNKMKIEKSNILRSGVRIFPEGVEKDSHGKEISRNQTRREKRQQRRIYYRRKQTIESITLELLKHDCFPKVTSIEGLENIEKSKIALADYYSIVDQKEKEKIFNGKFNAEKVLNETYLNLFISKFIQYYGLIQVRNKEDHCVAKAINILKAFFVLNPYELRNRAITNNEELTRYEFGRILYHLAQRKGFLSSAKNQKESDEIGEGLVTNINNTISTISQSGCKFYGDYFYKKMINGEKIRNTPTSRKEYIREFNQIWSDLQQKDIFKKILTGKPIDPYADEKTKSEIKEKNRGTWYEKICNKIIYYQRPLKSQKYLVGLCSLERKAIEREKDGNKVLNWQGKARCPISALPYEEYRMLCEINNIKIEQNGIERRLTDKEKDEIVKLYNSKEKIEIINHFAKKQLPAGARLLGIADKETVPSLNAFSVLKDCFGSRWPSDEKKQKEIWWKLYYDIKEEKGTTEKTEENDNGEKEEKKEKKSLAFVNESKWNLNDEALAKLREVFPFKGDTTIFGNPTHTQLIELFGKDVWNQMSYKRIGEKENIENKHKSLKGKFHLAEKKKKEDDKNIYQDDVWHTIFNHNNEKEWLLFHGKNKWNLNPEQIEFLKKIKLKQGYSSLSRNAIEKILVYLRKGLRRDQAVFLANVPEVFGGYLKEQKINWLNFEKQKNIEPDLLNIIDNEIPEELKRNKVLNHLVSTYYKDNAQEIKSDDEIKEFASSFANLTNNQKNFIRDEIKLLNDIWKEDPLKFRKKDYYIKTRKIGKAIEDYLQENFTFLSKKDLNKLYHPSQIESYPRGDKLGSPRSPGLNNPVVIQTLYELRHLVNELIEKKLINPYKDKVRLEMGRDLNDKSMRAAWRYWQNDRKELWEKYREDFRQAFPGVQNEECPPLKAFEPNEYDLLKYFLWKELDKANGGCCPYTGDKICFDKLFGDNSNFDIEHIIPYDLSCDDSFENLTLCDKSYNRDIKKNRIPSQLVNHHGDILQRVEKWKKIAGGKYFEMKKLKREIKKLQGASTAKLIKLKADKQVQLNKIRFDYDYYKSKYNKFTITIDKIDDKFKNRQLPETGYINRLALAYLKSVFFERENENKIHVFSVSAKALNQFKKFWLNEPEFEPKNRSEHTHHAKDALMAAFLDKGIYDRMAKAIRGKEDEWLRTEFKNRYKLVKPPIPNLKYEIEKSIRQILVSHKQNNKLITISEKKVNGRITKSVAVRGQIHDDNYYGKIKNQYNIGEQVMVKRKPLEKLSIDEITRIADKGVAQIITRKINELINDVIFFEIRSEDEKNYLKGFRLKKMTKEEEKRTKEKITEILSTNEFMNVAKKEGKTKGENIPIKSVKIKDASPEINFRSIYTLKQKKFVVPGNNLAIAIYGGRFPEKKGRETINRDYEVLPFIDAVKQKNRNIPANVGNKNLLTKLEYGDYVLAYDEDEKEPYEKDKKLSQSPNTISEIENIQQRLFRITRFDQNGNMTFERHFKAIKRPEEAPPIEGKIIENRGEVLRKGYKTFIGFKVAIDRLGNISPAH